MGESLVYLIVTLNLSSVSLLGKDEGASFALYSMKMMVGLISGIV